MGAGRQRDAQCRLPTGTGTLHRRRIHKYNILAPLQVDAINDERVDGRPGVLPQDLPPPGSAAAGAGADSDGSSDGEGGDGGGAGDTGAGDGTTTNDISSNMAAASLDGRS